jgi:hypothetical protein
VTETSSHERRHGHRHPPPLESKSSHWAPLRRMHRDRDSANAASTTRLDRDSFATFMGSRSVCARFLRRAPRRSRQSRVRRRRALVSRPRVRRGFSRGGMRSGRAWSPPGCRELSAFRVEVRRTSSSRAIAYGAIR